MKKITNQMRIAIFKSFRAEHEAIIVRTRITYARIPNPVGLSLESKAIIVVEIPSPV